ncbi:MAG TPA: YkgJ family cysteine cluster protein [Vicinamibacteria bacterium]|jgi:Fe-S-cluster containining protein
MDWIRRGLRFECQPDCGKCCTNDREGSVFVEPADIETLARKLSMTPRAFALAYTVREEGCDLELRKTGEGHCVFLSDNRCRVHEAKPLQCRAYPFLPLDGFTPIESAFTWNYEKKFCPGIGKGPLYSKREIAAVSRGRGDVRGYACAKREARRKK